MQLLVLRDIERKVRLSPTWLATMFERDFWKATIRGIEQMRALAQPQEEIRPPNADIDESLPQNPTDADATTDAPEVPPEPGQHDIAEAPEMPGQAHDHEASAAHELTGDARSDVHSVVGNREANGVAATVGFKDVPPAGEASSSGDRESPDGAEATVSNPPVAGDEGQDGADSATTAPVVALPALDMPAGVYYLVRHYLHSSIGAIAEAATACISHVFVHALARKSRAYVKGVLSRDDVAAVCRRLGQCSYPPLAMQLCQLLGYLLAVHQEAVASGGSASSSGVGGLDQVVAGGLEMRDVLQWIVESPNTLSVLWTLASRASLGNSDVALADDAARSNNGTPAPAVLPAEADEDRDNRYGTFTMDIPDAVRSSAAALLQAVLL